MPMSEFCQKQLLGQEMLGIRAARHERSNQGLILAPKTTQEGPRRSPGVPLLADPRSRWRAAEVGATAEPKSRTPLFALLASTNIRSQANPNIEAGPVVSAGHSNPNAGESGSQVTGEHGFRA